MSKIMKRKTTFWLLLAWLIPVLGMAQTVAPRAYYTDTDGNYKETISIDDGQAPLNVSFRANPDQMGDWTPSYEWHFRKQDANGGYEELLVRYEEDTDYMFNESGTFNVVLQTTLINGTDTTELSPETITISIAESRLEFPNAFSPNDDGTNDVYQAKKGKDGKDGYRSIVSFHGYIFNRWGQKLFEWTDVSKGWDGTYNGHPVKEGVYFALIKAKGADGKEYNFRKDVNLLRGHREGSGSDGGSAKE